jgi:hypothetical protein
MRADADGDDPVLRADNMLHRLDELVREAAMCYQDQADHV